jgi:hypothetical protein
MSQPPNSHGMGNAGCPWPSDHRPRSVAHNWVGGNVSTDGGRQVRRATGAPGLDGLYSQDLCRFERWGVMPRIRIPKVS